jgi:adenylate cyclase
MASRVQGATKYLKTDILITAATQAKLNGEFATRRLCQVRVINIKAPVELYELCPQPDAAWLGLRERYEQALGEFERQNFQNAAKILGSVVAEYPGEGASLVLLSRAVNAMVEPDHKFSSAWELSGK